MTEPDLKTVDMEPEEAMRICDEIYKAFLSPKYHGEPKDPWTPH